MKRYLFLLLLPILTSQSFANTLSVQGDSAEIRDSINPYIAETVLVVPQNYPLVVLDEKEDYFQVRDFLGREGWVKKNLMKSGDSVVVKVDNCNIRSGPGTGHEILFRADQGVAFKVLEKNTEWLRVEHEDGKQGWVFEKLVWGLNP